MLGDFLLGNTAGSMFMIDSKGAFDPAGALATTLNIPFKEQKIARYKEALNKPEDALQKILDDDKALATEVSVLVKTNYDKFRDAGIEDLSARQSALKIGETIYKMQQNVNKSIYSNSDVLEVGLRKHLTGIDQGTLDRLLAEALQ